MGTPGLCGVDGLFLDGAEGEHRGDDDDHEDFGDFGGGADFDPRRRRLVPRWTWRVQSRS